MKDEIMKADDFKLDQFFVEPVANCRPITIEQMQRLLGKMLVDGATLDHELWFTTTIAGDSPGEMQKHTLPITSIKRERGHKRKRVLLSDEQGVACPKCGKSDKVVQSRTTDHPGCFRCERCQHPFCA